MLKDQGGPKKKRIRGADEKEGKKVSRRIHKCIRCNGWGHHRNGCKEPIGTAAESSTQTIAEM